MSSFNKTNPTHGGAVSTGPGSKERKAEHTGLVANDSLAAESLRSGGEFAKGNPTGISDVSGSKGTFAGNTEGEVAEVFQGKRTQKVEKIGSKEFRPGALDDTSGGYMRKEAFDGDYDGPRDTANSKNASGGVQEGRGSRHTGGGASARITREAHKGDDHSQGRSKSEGHIEGSKGTHKTETQRKEKTSGPEKVTVQDTEPTAEIGSENDPGRVAENEFARKNAIRDHDFSHGDTTTGKQENPYGVLNVE